MGVEAMVFDVGRVLVDWRPERLYARLEPDAARRQAFFDAIGLHDWNLDFDRGRPMRAGVEADAAAMPEHAALIRAWWEMWPEMFGPEIPGSVAILRALKARGAPVYGLTNFNHETWERAVALYPFLGEFDDVVVSGREKCVKPEPRIYEILEERTGRAPHALFFADDSAANVAAARARGWTAHLFEGPAGLARALGEIGLLPADAAAELEARG